ncbi:MAG: DNA recombination protein RmuC [Candidatus Eremiobacteraeota bacterium]|nr:DNA recombination protein RmuC [Candidatus Eremiobacteraeota bacterium]
MTIISLPNLLAIMVAGAFGFAIACFMQNAKATALKAEVDRERHNASEARDKLEGAIADAALCRGSLQTERESFSRERAGLTEQMSASFQKMACEALKATNDQFLGFAEQRLGQEREKTDGTLRTILSPIQEDLKKFSGSIASIEQQRASAFSELHANVKIFGERQGELLNAISTTNMATDRLSTALANPKVAGNWGEIALEKIVELAGMTDHCDFSLQEQFKHEEGIERPDLIVNLTGGLRIPVDAKVPLVNYRAAFQAADPAIRAKLLSESAADLKGHVKALMSRGYDKVEGYAGMTILFVPVESMLASALATEGELLQFGAQNRITICSPLLFLAYLQAFGHGWRMQKQRDNAEQVAQIGKRLYNRMVKFANMLNEVGIQLERATCKYNVAVNSFTGRLIPSGKAIGTMLGAQEKLKAVEPVDSVPRQVGPLDIAVLDSANDAADDVEREELEEKF